MRDKKVKIFTSLRDLQHIFTFKIYNLTFKIVKITFKIYNLTFKIYKKFQNLQNVLSGASKPFLFEIV